MGELKPPKLLGMFAWEGVEVVLDILVALFCPLHDTLHKY
jgi:hypothetical protein